MPLNNFDNNSTLVQVIAWCCLATNHYLNQCRLSIMKPYGVTRPQWVPEPMLICHHWDENSKLNDHHSFRWWLGAIGAKPLSEPMWCILSYRSDMESVTIWENWKATSLYSHYRNQAIIKANDDPVPLCTYASLDLSVLTDAVNITMETDIANMHVSQQSGEISVAIPMGILKFRS